MIFASRMSVAVGHRSMRGAFTHQAESQGTTPSMISFPGRSPPPEFLQWRNQRDSPEVTADARMDWLSSMTEWEVIDMGCHGCHHASRLLYQCFSKLCWCGCQDGGLEIVSQVCGLDNVVIFQPIALETLGPMNSSAIEFFTVLGRKIGVFRRWERRALFSAAIRGSAARQRNFADESLVGVDDAHL